MDPVTAVALMIKAIAEMVTEMVKGQTPEEKAKIWQWWLDDQARWRKFFKLDP